jgi:hypothetical protein
MVYTVDVRLPIILLKEFSSEMRYCYGGIFSVSMILIMSSSNVLSGVTYMICVYIQDDWNDDRIYT